MKKKLLTLGVFASLTLVSYSQEIFSENFDSQNVFPSGWALHNVDGLTPHAQMASFTTAWVVDDIDPAYGNNAASNSWYTPVGAANDWMVTPSISIPNTGQYVLQFESRSKDPNYLESFKVYVSTTGQAVSDFSAAPVLSVDGNPGDWTMNSIDLSAYAGQTVYIAFRNVSNDKFLLLVDNIVVRQPQLNDAKLVAASLSRYAPTSTNSTLSTSILNDGSNPITSIVMNWNDGTDHSSQISVNIAPGQTATVNHPTAVNYAAVEEKNIAVTVTQVNNATDPIPSNNTATKKHNTLSAVPARNVVFEEGTGTWCGFCVRGAVAMDYMTDLYDDFIGIAVHNGDPMALSSYSSSLNLSGYPGSNVDRTILGCDVSNSAWNTAYQQQKNVVTPAVVGLTTSVSGSTVTVETSTVFKTKFANANYKLAIVMVEDSVRGTESGYNQSNYYAGGAYGAMGGFESLTNPVPASQMVYNHVARAIIGGYTGQDGSVPSVITEGTEYNYTFTYDVPATSNIDNMHAVALLIDSGTGEILNAGKVGLTTASLQQIKADQALFEMYPNPLNNDEQILNLSLSEKNTDYVVAITDLMGKVICSDSIKNAGSIYTLDLSKEKLTKGVYLVSVSTKGATYTKQLVVQ